MIVMVLFAFIYSTCNTDALDGSGGYCLCICIVCRASCIMHYTLCDVTRTIDIKHSSISYTFSILDTKPLEVSQQ